MKKLPFHVIQLLKQSQQDDFNNSPIKSIEFKSAIITLKHPNNTVLLTNKKIMQISNIFIPRGENCIYVSGLQLKKVGPIYEYRFSFEYLNMWIVNDRNCPIVTYPLNNVEKKMVYFVITINNKRKMYPMPLLHM